MLRAQEKMMMGEGMQQMGELGRLQGSRAACIALRSFTKGGWQRQCSAQWQATALRGRAQRPKCGAM